MTTPTQARSAARDEGQEQFTIPELRITLFAEREKLAEVAQENARLRASEARLVAALDRIMEYAHLGAQCCDIDVNEQPQFIAARAAIARAEAERGVKE